MTAAQAIIRFVFVAATRSNRAAVLAVLVAIAVSVSVVVVVAAVDFLHSPLLQPPWQLLTSYHTALTCLLSTSCYQKKYSITTSCCHCCCQLFSPA